MRNLIDKVFTTTQYTSALEKERAGLIYGTSALMAVLTLLFLAVWRDSATSAPAWQRTELILAAGVLYILLAASIVLVRLQRLNLAGFVVFLVWAAASILLTAQPGLYPLIGGFLIVVTISLTCLLSGIQGLLPGALVTVILLFLGMSQHGQPASQAVSADAQLFSGLITALGVIVVTYIFLGRVRLAQEQGAVDAVQQSLEVADVIAKITHHVARRATLPTLLDDIVRRIRDSFPEIYHAQVFLISSTGDTAHLAASTGDVGKKLMERQHKLGVGSLSVIGQVTFKGTPVIAQAGSTDTIHRRNEFLPETRAEAALPLRIGDRVIGALDLQSKQSGAFSQRIVETFMALADGIALAIDNVQQFERAEARVKENQQLVEQTRIALREVERLNERLTGRAWSDYLRRHSDDLGLTIDFERSAQEPTSAWTDSMREAAATNHFVQKEDEHGQVIALPLRVRGQVVGAVEFELDRWQAFSPEDFNLIQEVGERFSLAAENTRLVEESQHIAQREALVNEISSRLQSTNNVQSTLTEAARSLRETLKADRVAIRLGTPPSENGQ